MRTQFYSATASADCLKLRDQAYREDQERYYARWEEIAEWEKTMLKNSDQIYRDAIAMINGIRNEQILILTGQYIAKATAANALYLACLGTGRVDITGRTVARCSSIYTASMTALTIGHDKAVEEANEEAMEDIEEAGIEKIARDALIKESARKRRHWKHCEA